MEARLAVATIRDEVTVCGGVAGGGDTTQLSCGPIRVGGAALARHVRRPVGARANGGAVEAVQGTLSFEVSGMLPIVLEKLKERLTRTPVRTHNRIKSPR